jgi:RecB family exonuclease
VITPRRTRLIRVRDPHEFRDAIVGFLAPRGAISPDTLPRLVIVPHVAAAAELRASCRRRGVPLDSPDMPEFVSRDEFYDRLRDRLVDPPDRLSSYDRDAIAQAAAREAAEQARHAQLDLRPGLIAEMLRFYDQLRRQSQSVSRFEELLRSTLEREVDFDRGAERLLRQTQLLAAVFRGYERRLEETGACDEHALRDRLIADPAPRPVRGITVTVPDWIASPHGLHVADFGLLTRLPGLESVDVIATNRVLASGFHQRIHEWLPGLEEVTFQAENSGPQPTLVVSGGATEQAYCVSRDREEELIDIARRLKEDRRSTAADEPVRLDRVAVVYKRPLPYLYLAREVFGGAGIPYQTSDRLPLAAEPFASALDLVFECVSSSFSRRALVALLRSPHFRFDWEGKGLSRADVSALDRVLSDARYLGGIDSLRFLADPACHDQARAADSALRVAVALADRLAPFCEPAPLPIHVERLLSFLASHDLQRDLASPLDSPRPAPLAPHERRAREAIVTTLAAVSAARNAHDRAAVEIDEFAAIIWRAIEAQTLPLEPGGVERGLHLLDDHAAPYGDFDEVTIVGLIEGDWPDPPSRNIFYPAALLNALGWPSERDRRYAAEARFLDLVTSPTRRTRLSTITLEDDALVEPSGFLHDIPRAELQVVARDPQPGVRIMLEEALSLDPVEMTGLAPEARRWAELRLTRSPQEEHAFHGQTAALPTEGWPVSWLETYLACPFKFFAEHVLGLQEDPDDEEVMDPRRRGRFVHQVFEAFFRSWQASGRHEIEPANLAEARGLFERVVEEHLAPLSAAEAALERTRLMGSSVAAGLGDAVLRMELERPVGVVERRIEYPLRGAFRFLTEAGPRTIELRGKVDRLDLLADGTFRVVDYKLGWPPNTARALQLPVYSLCAEQRLDGYQGRHWQIGEAAYLAFQGPRRVVPLFQAASRERVLRDAQDRLVSAVDAIARGEFPPRPDDVFRCETCAFSPVCRKDYVGDY